MASYTPHSFGSAPGQTAHARHISMIATWDPLKPWDVFLAEPTQRDQVKWAQQIDMNDTLSMRSSPCYRLNDGDVRSNFFASPAAGTGDSTTEGEMKKEATVSTIYSAPASLTKVKDQSRTAGRNTPSVLLEVNVQDPNLIPQGIGLFEASCDYEVYVYSSRGDYQLDTLVWDPHKYAHNATSKANWRTLVFHKSGKISTDPTDDPYWESYSLEGRVYCYWMGFGE